MKAIKNIFAVGIGLLILASSLSAGLTYSFVAISSNSTADKVIGESQLSVELFDLGFSQVKFVFSNKGPDASTITDIYWGGAPGLLIKKSISGVSGVVYNWDAFPSNLPGSYWEASVSADADSPVLIKGVNPGETVGFVFDIGLGKSFADIVSGIHDLSLATGIHVQGFPDGISESFELRNNNTVINIDAALYGDPGTGMNTLKLPFVEGYYVCEFVTPSIDLRALYTAWSAWQEGSAWYSAYGIKVGQRIFNNGSHIACSSPEEAFAAAEPKTIQFYVPQAMDVEFYIADNAVADNRGGISLLVRRTSPADFDGSLAVDFMDFAIFAKAWLTSESELSFNWRCDTTFDNIIDLNDLVVFASDWLGGVTP